MDIVPAMLIVVGALVLTASVLSDTRLHVGHWCRHLMPTRIRWPHDG